MTTEFLAPLGGIVRLLVFDGTQRRDSSKHVTYLWSGRFPEGSFYELKGGVFVASPEFAFLAAATLLDKTQLIAFGCELCGYYSFDRREKRGFRKRRVPLLTVERLRDYLVRAEGCRGYKKAASALLHIVEHSASPMETFDVMALCLPYRLGGYGLDVPLMNHKVSLTPRAAHIAKRQSCFPDICYLSVQLDIEHHGKLDHSDPEDQASDRARVNALKEMGFEVIELTKDQVNDLLSFEYIVQRIARLLGRRLRKECLGATPARLAFRSNVLAWNQSSGKLR
ncbi:MAG: hypothetical protein IJ111_01885 [Eggerthellaceae bacterium]|nr:hypothetical protein [Eggerthellaceae bacterium]